jgi:hypothetical protein
MMVLTIPGPIVDNIVENVILNPLSKVFDDKEAVLRNQISQSNGF